MKSILKSLKPKILVNILNGYATLLIAKKFPKDYKGWVYIYCTKATIKDYLIKYFRRYLIIDTDKTVFHGPYNGNVVACFYCDNVEEIAYECGNNGIYDNGYKWFYTEKLDLPQNFEKACCLDENELYNYLLPKRPFGTTCGYAIHISQLEIFDKPKKLSEFKQPRNSYGKVDFKAKDYYLTELTKAPQNYCYVETEE